METTNELRERLISYIDAELGKRKPEIEVGKWYKTPMGSIINWQGCLDTSYGLTNAKNWCNNWWNIDINELVIAAESEITEALKTECLKRFKVGDVVKSARFGYEFHIYNLDFYYKDGILWHGANALFYNGKFATVIESKQTIESTTGNVLVFTKPIDNELLTKIKNLL